MTERGLPIVDGAPACPFVAFEDDRDERAASPDHRHRCYAEAQPAPRALAHQEAYCLSSAFPVCPTFQDWARREAARSRVDGPPARNLDSVAAAATAPSTQRNPPRNWSAPPPWAGRGESRDPSLEGDWTEQDAADEGAENLPAQGRGLSGSYADRVASAPGAAGVEGGLPGPGGPGDSAGADEPWQEPGRGDDDEDEFDDPDAPVGAVPPYAPPMDQQAPPYDDRQAAAWADRDEDEAGNAAEPPRRRRERDPERIAALGGGVRGAARGADRRVPASAAGPRPERRRDRDAPEWERPRAMEAYPTLRSRRLSELSIPPLLVAVVALALAAAVLFALPGLLGFGNPSSGASNQPSVPVATQLITPAPTPIPQPTEQLYVVKAGDTLSRIAGRFGITLQELIAANAETLPDPNKLQIGDQLIIPAQNPDDLPAASEIPGAT